MQQLNKSDSFEFWLLPPTQEELLQYQRHQEEVLPQYLLQRLSKRQMKSFPPELHL